MNNTGRDARRHRAHPLTIPLLAGPGAIATVTAETTTTAAGRPINLAAVLLIASAMRDLT